MISAIASVLFYTLVAAASPVAFTATLLVIRSERPRTNGIAFLTGFLVGTTVAAVLGLIVGQAIVGRFDSHATFEALLALATGVALVIAGLRERRTPSTGSTASGRGAAILAGLGRVGPGAAFSMAGLLGFGGPKRLVLTVLAMASVTQADLGTVENIALLALYVAVATLIVSVPISFVTVGGTRAAALIARSESWLKTNETLLRIWLALVLGAALVIDGLVRLLG